MLNRKVAEARAAGVDVISLGIGDPDMQPPAELFDVFDRETRRRRTPTSTRRTAACASCARRVAGHYARRFGVVLDPEREVIPLLGAKEGLAHLCLAQLDAGDAALVADPGYPVYRGGPAIAGAEADRAAPARGARLPARPRRASPTQMRGAPTC